MNRLQSEQQRLFGPRNARSSNLQDQGANTAATSPKVRALVMSLTHSPTWAELALVWRGVQSELGLPAPAIAVAGAGGLQLWFSLEEPVAAPRALAFLDALRLRFLPDVKAVRVRSHCHRGLQQASTSPALLHAQAHDLRLIPAALDEPGRWSAFVASDLVAVFEDTPWLDMEPGEEGQAALLRGLEVMEAAAFQWACLQLGLPDVSYSLASAAVESHVAVASDLNQAQLSSPTAPAAGAETDPRRFLLHVMNDSSVALALRVEAAKALLQHAAQPPSAVAG